MGLYHPEALYICFEGPEGAGKSTIARRVADHIGAVLTRETGGTPIGVRLRDILHDTTVTELDDRAEALIAAADRAQHIAEIVAPSLLLGRHVVSDRCSWSTKAYQGYGRGRDLAPLEWLIEYATNGFMQPTWFFCWTYHSKM